MFLCCWAEDWFEFWADDTSLEDDKLFCLTFNHSQQWLGLADMAKYITAVTFLVVSLGPILSF